MKKLEHQKKGKKGGMGSMVTLLPSSNATTSSNKSKQSIKVSDFSRKGKNKLRSPPPKKKNP